jgi:hypothetical protein
MPLPLITSSLTGVPEALAKSARMVTLNHPASLDCQVWRKVFLRMDETSTTDVLGGAGESFGGQPMLGGIPVLADDEEADMDYQPVGPDDAFHGKLQILQPYQGASMFDNGQGADAPQLVEARIEPLAGPDEAGYFEVGKGDMVMVFPGLGVVLTYFVQDKVNTLMLPPFVPKLVLEAAGNLTHIPAVAQFLDGV